MICCKIVTNYNDPMGHFNDLLTLCSKHGDILWDSGNLFFSSQESSINYQQIKSWAKTAGYPNVYIDVYTKDNQPANFSEYILGWLTDHLMQNSYKAYELESQEVFKNISVGLDMLDHQLDVMIKEKNKNADTGS